MNGSNLMSFFQGGGKGAPQLPPQGFNGGNQQPQQQGQQPQGGHNFNPNPNVVDSNQFQNVPGGNNQQQPQPQGNGNQQQPAVQPLDGFADIFKNDPQKPTASPWESLTNPLFTPDFDELGKKVTSASFSPDLSPEQIQQLQSGNPQAYQSVFNQVAQNTFMQAVKYMHNMMESGFKTYSGRLDPALQSRFTEFQSGLEVTKANPLLQHENAKPVVDSLRQLFASRMPNASPAQIAEKVNSYLKLLAADPNATNTQQQPNTGVDPVTGQPLRNAPTDMDWGNNFFGN